MRRKKNRRTYNSHTQACAYLILRERTRPRSSSPALQLIENEAVIPS